MPTTPLPFNADIAAKRRQRLQQHQDLLNNILQARQGADANYQAGTAAIDIARPQTFRSLLSNAAGRGMAFSSGYAQDVSNANNEFATQLSQLAQQRTAQYADTDAQTASENQSFNYDLSDLQNQQAAYEAQNQAATAALAQQQAVQQSVINKNNAQAKAAGQRPVVKRIGSRKTGNTGINPAANKKRIFMKNHPVYSKLQPDQRKIFLRKHGRIAGAAKRAGVV